MRVITHKTQDSALESSEKAACLSHFKILSKQWICNLANLFTRIISECTLCMKYYFISEKSPVQVIGGICDLGDDLYSAGLHIPTSPTYNCRIDTEQSQPLFHSPHSCLEHDSWICWALLTPEGWTGCVFLVSKPEWALMKHAKTYGTLYEMKLKTFTLTFFLPFLTFSNKGLLLLPFLEHGARDMCKSLNSLAFSYVWSLDLRGSCLFVY